MTKQEILKQKEILRKFLEEAREKSSYLDDKGKAEYKTIISVLKKEETTIVPENSLRYLLKIGMKGVIVEDMLFDTGRHQIDFENIFFCNDSETGTNHMVMSCYYTFILTPEDEELVKNAMIQFNTKSA